MSKTPVIQFLESVAEPPGLDEFQAALNDSVDAIVRLGEEKGYTFTAQELGKAITQLMEDAPSPQDLSEQELEGVVGGTRLSTSSSLTGLTSTLFAYHNYESTGDFTGWTY